MMPDFVKQEVEQRPRFITVCYGQHRSQWVKVLKGAFSKNMFHFLFFSGSCYGGHYHAYIRDVEGLGTWHQPVSRM